jgi:hypothetical protein
MQELNLFAIYTEILAKNNIEYFISGSVAAIVYGEPRLTNDIDLIISLSDNDIIKFIAAFPSDLFYCPPEEVIKTEIKRTSRGHFNLIHQETGFKADVYLTGQEKLQKWALENKVKINFAGSDIFLAPVEYVIIKKLEFYKEGNSQKHIEDVKNILISSESLINFVFLNKNLKDLGLEEVWSLVRKV